jgi:hypothetical protein
MHRIFNAYASEDGVIHEDVVRQRVTKIFGDDPEVRGVCLCCERPHHGGRVVSTEKPPSSGCLLYAAWYFSRTGCRGNVQFPG